MMFAGQTVGHVHFAAYALSVIFFAAYSFWQLWVLTRPRIKELFFEGSFQQFAAANPAAAEIQADVNAGRHDLARTKLQAFMDTW